MKITEAQIKMFESLQGSGTGKELIGFIECLLDDLCDIRKMKVLSQEEYNARTSLVSIIESELINRLKHQATHNGSVTNSFE